MFISLGVALIIVDSTIVNVAIPSIINDIGITSTQAQWVQEIYTLVFAALLLVGGRLADQYGRRRLFLLGTVIFAGASVLAALAGDGTQLIAARAVQGLGGALMLPTSLSLLNAYFRGRDRGVAFGIWGATIGGTAALGPLLGGWLTTSYSWRWAFGINIPLGLLVIAGLLLLVPESKDPSGQRGADWFGAVLSAIGFGGIVFGLIEGRTYGWLATTKPLTIGSWSWPWSVSPVPVAFVIGFAALSVFVAVERQRNRRGQVSMLDLNLFSIKSFRNGNIAAAIVSLGEFGILFSLPLWFQNVIGYTAFQTGLALLALAGGSFLASGLTAPIGRKRGTIFIVRLGIVLEIIGIAGLAIFLRPDSTWLNDHAAAPRVRHRCRLRDCAADWRCADGRTTEPQRRGLGHPEHISAGRVGARHRHPRHCAVRHTRRKVRHRAGRSWRIGSPASAACRRSQGQRGSRDSKPGCQSGYCSCRRACAGRLHRRLAGSRFDSRGLPRHRTGGKPVSGEPTASSIG